MPGQPSLLHRDLLIGLVLLVVVVVAEALLYPTIVQPTIDAAWNGTSSFSWLNGAVASRVTSDPGLYDLEHIHWMGRTLATRLGILWFVCLGVWIGWRHRGRLADMLRGFFTEKDMPFNLGVFRVVVFGMMYYFVGKEDLAFYSSLPKVLHFPPVGLGPILAKMPASPELAENLLLLFRSCCLMAMFGLFTRFTTVLSTILALYVLGIPQMFGKVNHSHHLVWFGALLAASRCGDALSIDALFRRMRGRPEPIEAIAYALPLRITWILLGLIYFFPGFWKIWGGGVDWIFGDHLRFQMYHLWSTHVDRSAMPSMSESKVLVTLGGIGTILFELSFIFLVFNRRTRVLAAIGGLCFHTASALTLRIAFYSLQLSFISLIDWRRLLGRLGIMQRAGNSAPLENNHRPPNPVPIAIVGMIIVIPTLFLGFKGENNGWPFACYPRFSYPIFSPERDIIEIDTIGPGGDIVARNELADLRSRFRTARWVGLLRRTLLTSDPDLLRDRLAALSELSGTELKPGETMRFLRATYSTIPEEWGDPPLRREILTEIRMNPEP